MELELELVSPPHTSLTIRVPASTANIGPGFDTLGMGLALYLTLEVDMWKRDSESTSSTTQSPSSEPTVVSLVCQGDYASGISTDPSVNLITTYVSRPVTLHSDSKSLQSIPFFHTSYNIHPSFIPRCSTAAKVATSTSSYFPPPSLSHIRITCFNNIPLGSGLGSSGSAVVAGVLLANHVCVLGLKEEEVLDACLAIEGHPDNVSPSLLGGFIAAYMREQQPISSHCNTTTSHSQPPPTSSSSIIPSVSSPHSNNNSRIGRYIKLRLSPSIRAVAVTPHFPLPTHLARSVLPPHYTRADIIFNMQRIAVLVAALAADVPDPWLVYEAMQDRKVFCRVG